MKHAYTLIPFLVVVISCATQPKQTGPEAILVQMRADTSWIHHLDSLAQTAIGPGAKCLDPVSHSFTYDGRTWIFNQDWSGVLEIPADYIIEDDLWQAKISFHGTHVWSPDSTILVSFYAGFQCLDMEEFTESILESLEEDGFTVFRRDKKEEVLTVFARSRRGSPRLAHGTDQAGSRGQLRADGLRRVPHPPGGQGPARRQGQVHRGIPADRSQILKEPCT